MKTLLLLLLSLSILVDSSRGASIIIDSGSPSDSNFTGGISFTIQTGTLPDKTIRSGQSFSYTVPANEGIPYVLTFTFVEPCSPGAGCGSLVTGPNQRVFSVTVNDQPVIPRLDIFAAAGGSGLAIKRSVVLMPSNTGFVITFTGILKTAVVSSIEFTPLFEIFGQ